MATESYLENLKAEISDRIKELAPLAVEYSKLVNTLEAMERDPWPTVAADPVNKPPTTPAPVTHPRRGRSAALDDDIIRQLENGAATAKQLATQLQRPPTSVSRAAKRMQGRGLLRKEGDLWIKR